MLNKVTLKDIAKRAGVSAMTVSAAVNGGGRISESKAAEIRKLVLEMGYKTNAAAQILKRKRGSEVGLLFLETLEIVRRLGALSQIALLASEECRRLGLRLHVEWFDYESNTHKLPEILFNGLANGLIVYGYGNEEIDKYLRTAHADFPIVRIMEPGELSVYVDFEYAIRSAMTYLAALGHRRIGLINGDSSTNFHIFRISKETFFRSAESFSIPASSLSYFEFTPKMGMEYAAQMAGLVEWAEVQNVSALIVFSATTAKAVICEMLRRGVKVPEDLSVLAFGSFDFDSEFNIPISSIDIDIPSIVSHAVRLLSESMQGKEIPQKQFAIRSELILRGSVIHAH